MEMLEPRMLLSVSAATLIGPMQSQGERYVYALLELNRTETVTVRGPTTAPTGQSAIELDYHEVQIGGPGGSSTQDVRMYSALTSNGLVDYASHQDWTNPNGSGSADETFLPFEVELPPTLSAGQAYQNSYVTMNVTGAGDQTTSHDTSTISLVSDTPQPVTVRAGTFDAYEVMVISPPSQEDGGTYTITTLNYYAPAIGLVKVVKEMGTNPDGTVRQNTSIYTAVLESKTNVSNLTWTGDGDGLNWSDPKNWDQNAAPANGDSLNFPAGAPATSHNDMAGLSIKKIDIQGSGYTLSGNSISLTGGLTSETGNNTYDLDTTLVGSPTLEDWTGDLTIDAVFSGSGGLTLSGAGEFTFDEIDTYTGPTTLSAGITIDDDALSDMFADSTVTIGAGAKPVTINAPINRTVELDNDILFQDGATLACDPEVILTGTVTVNGKSTVAATGADDQMTLKGSTIQGTGTLTVQGDGKVQIQGDLISTVQLIVASGELDLGASLQGALNGTAQVVVSGGTLHLLNSLQGSGGIDIQGGATVQTDGSSGYYGTITLEAGATKSTVGTVVLTPNPDDLGRGQLILPTGNPDPDTGPIFDASGTQQTVTLNNPLTFQSTTQLTVKGHVTFAGPVNLNGSAFLATTSLTDQIGITRSVLGTGVLIAKGAGTITINGVVGETAKLAVFQGELDVGANLLGAVGDPFQQVQINGGTLRLLSSLQGSGEIGLLAGSLISGGTSGYYGAVTVAFNEFQNTVILLAGQNDLGTGQLLIKGLNAGGGSSGANALIPIFDASGAGQRVTLSNAVSFDHDSDLKVQGLLNFSGVVTINNPDVVETASDTDQLELTGGIQGTGQLLVGGLGTTTIDGNLGDDVKVTGVRGRLALGANLSGSFSQIVLDGGTLLSNGTSSYDGTIKLLQAGGTLVVTGNPDQFGTAQLLVANDHPDIPGPPPIIDATASPFGLLSNEINFRAGGSVATKGDVRLSGLLTLNGNGVITMRGDSDRLRLSGGMNQTQGTGTLSMNGPGTISVFGDIPAGVSLSYVATGPSGELDLGANLLGDVDAPSQVKESLGKIMLLSTLEGTGGIDVADSATLTSKGASGYNGTITLEARSVVIPTAIPNDLGRGKLVVDNSDPAHRPIIDSTANVQTVTLNNPLFFQTPLFTNNMGLIVKGSVNFSGAVTLNGDAELDTDSSSDQLNLFGGVQGAGTLTLDGPGVTSIAGSVAAGVTLQEAGQLAGTTVALIIGANLQGAGDQLLVQGGLVEITTMSGGGGIQVLSGTLATNQTSGSGSPSYFGSVTLADGGIIQDYDSADTMGLGKGSLILGGGTLQNSSGSTAVLGNPVTVQGSATVSGGSRLKFTQSLNVTGNGTLDVQGALALFGSLTGSGTIVLDGVLFAVNSIDNPFSGTIVVNSGIVEVTSNDALGTGPLVANLKSQGVLKSVGNIGDPILDNPLTVAQGTLILQGLLTFPNGITVGAGATLDVEGADTQIVVTGPMAGGGHIVVGAGILSIHGDIGSFFGTVDIQGGNILPGLAVSDAGGVYNGSSFPATVLGLGLSPDGSLEGVFPVLAYYVGNTAGGPGSAVAPSDPGTYTVVASFAGSAHYLSDQSAPVTFSILPSEQIILHGKKTQTATNTATFLDANGVAETVTWSGPAASTATLVRYINPADPEGKQRGDLYTVTIDGSDEKSTLTITTKGQGTTAQASVEDIVVHGSLKSIKAVTTSLLGDLTVDGTLASLTMDDAIAGSTISIGPRPASDTKTATSLTFDQVAEAQLAFQTPIKSLTITQWLDNDETADIISAPFIGTLMVKGDKERSLVGDFAASLVLSGAGNPKHTLGQAKIAGALSLANWQITGNAGSIAAGTVQGAQIDVTGAVSAFKLGAVADTDLTVSGSLGTLQAARWDGGSVQAGYVGKVNVTGDSKKGLAGDFGADLTVTGQGAAAGKPVLGSATIAGNLASGSLWRILAGDMGRLTVKGMACGSVIRSAGSMLGITLGASDGSSFLAGIADDCPRYAEQHTSGHDDFVNVTARIKSIAIKGLAVPQGQQPPRFLSDTYFSAAYIDSVSLLNADFPTCGLFARDSGPALEIKSVKYRDTATGERWSWPVKPGTVFTGPGDLIQMI